jgi:hypothetical protein
VFLSTFEKQLDAKRRIVVPAEFREVVAGHAPKTSPNAFVFTSAPIAVPVLSAPLTWIGFANQVPAGPAVRRFMNAGVLLCQIAYIWFLKGEDALWSTQTICLSAFVCVPEGVASNVQVAPLSVE